MNQQQGPRYQRHRGGRGAGKEGEVGCQHQHGNGNGRGQGAGGAEAGHQLEASHRGQGEARRVEGLVEGEQHHGKHRPHQPGDQHDPEGVLGDGVGGQLGAGGPVEIGQPQADGDYEQCHDGEADGPLPVGA